MLAGHDQSIEQDIPEAQPSAMTAQESSLQKSQIEAVHSVTAFTEPSEADGTLLTATAPADNLAGSVEKTAPVFEAKEEPLTKLTVGLFSA